MESNKEDASNKKDDSMIRVTTPRLGRMKNIVFANNLPIIALPKEQWEAYHSATRCHICEKLHRMTRRYAIFVISSVYTAVQRMQTTI